MTTLAVEGGVMQLFFAALLLSIFGAMALAAPKRRRFRRRTAAGHGSFDGEDNDTGAGDGGYDGGFDGGDGGGGGGGDGGGGD
jgi:hypothetical protein